MQTKRVNITLHSPATVAQIGVLVTRARRSKMKIDQFVLVVGRRCLAQARVFKNAGCQMVHSSLNDTQVHVPAQVRRCRYCVVWVYQINLRACTE